jgi:hypothetical protein
MAGISLLGGKVLVLGEEEVSLLDLGEVAGSPYVGGGECIQTKISASQ